jgi:hypothetical protein
MSNNETIMQFDDHGTLVEVDKKTGEVVDKHKTLKQYMTKVEEPKPSQIALWVFNQGYADLIVQKMIEDNLSLTKVCKLPGMPTYSTVTRWRHENPNFDDYINYAMRAQADKVTDEIHDSRDAEYEDKHELNSAKLNFDKKKHIAAVKNPEKYSPRVRGGEGGGTVVQIMVDTGIKREEAVTIECEVNKE